MPTSLLDPTCTGQHMDALRRANEVRLARADLKRRLKRGKLDAADLLLDPPDYIDAMRIADLLAAQPRWGTIRVRRFCQRVPVSETRPIGDLTYRQRRVIAEAVLSGGQLAPC